VIADAGYIRIDPFQPQFIYVPTYDPNIVYVRRGSAGIISFGVGLAIGAWLNSDCDWSGHRIYYHGWQRSGWIARSRPNVRITNIYVNNNYRNIQINRNVVQRSVNYNNLNRYSSVHRDVNYNNVGRNNKGIPVNPSASNKIIRRNVDVTDPRIDTYRGHARAQQPAEQANRPPPPAAPTRPAPSTRREERPPATQPQPAPIERGKPPQIARPAPQQAQREIERPASSVFSGNRSGFDPRAVSQRGQASRAQANQPAARPSPKAPNPPANRSGRAEPQRRK